MVHEIKTVLHAHPHFLAPLTPKRKFNPLYHLWNADQSAYRLLHPVPSLEKIVRFNFERKIGISAISECHTSTGGMDPRFEEYMKQRKSLDKDFETSYDSERGILTVAKNKPVKDELPHIILFHSQEVRTMYKGMPADINISFVNTPINHSQDIDETAKIGLDKGGYVTVCHGNSPACSAGIEKTIEMVSERKVDTAESFNSTEEPEYNESLRRDLRDAGIFGVAVPDSHHYTDEGSYFLVNYSLYQDFSVDNLRETIEKGDFENHFEYHSDRSKFVNHTLPILMLLPLTTLKHPVANTKALTKAFKAKLFSSRT